MDNDKNKKNSSSFNNLDFLKLELSHVVEDRMLNGKNVESLSFTLKLNENLIEDNFEQLVESSYYGDEIVDEGFVVDIEIFPYGSFIADSLDYLKNNGVVLSYSFEKSDFYKEFYDNNFGDIFEY